MTDQGTTTTDRYIDQVLSGPCCGRFVPQPEEIDSTTAELGIECIAEHPEFVQEPEEGFEHDSFRDLWNRIIRQGYKPSRSPPTGGGTRRRGLASTVRPGTSATSTWGTSTP